MSPLTMQIVSLTTIIVRTIVSAVRVVSEVAAVCPALRRGGRGCVPGEHWHANGRRVDVCAPIVVLVDELCRLSNDAEGRVEEEEQSHRDE